MYPSGCWWYGSDFGHSLLFSCSVARIDFCFLNLFVVSSPCTRCNRNCIQVESPNPSLATKVSLKLRKKPLVGKNCRKSTLAPLLSLLGRGRSCEVDCGLM